MKCNRCGQINPEGSAYCAGCGSPLGAWQAAPPEYVQQPPAPPAPPSRRRTKTILMAVLIPVLLIGLLAAGFFLLPLFEPLRTSIFEGKSPADAEEDFDDEDSDDDGQGGFFLTDKSSEEKALSGTWKGRLQFDFPPEAVKQSALLSGLRGRSSEVELLLTPEAAELHFEKAVIPLEIQNDGKRLLLQGKVAEGESIQIELPLENQEDEGNLEALGEVLYRVGSFEETCELSLREKSRKTPELQAELLVEYPSLTSSAEETTAAETTTEETTAEETTAAETTTEETTAIETTAAETTPEETTAEKTTAEKTTAEKSEPADTSPKTTESADESKVTSAEPEVTESFSAETEYLPLPESSETHAPVDPEILADVKAYLCGKRWAVHPFSNPYNESTEVYVFHEDGSFECGYWTRESDSFSIYALGEDEPEGWAQTESVSGRYSYYEDYDPCLEFRFPGAESCYNYMFRRINENFLELPSIGYEGATLYLSAVPQSASDNPITFPDLDELLDFQTLFTKGEDGNYLMPEAVRLLEGYYYGGDTPYYTVFEEVYGGLEYMSMQLIKNDDPEADKLSNLRVIFRALGTDRPFELDLLGGYDPDSGVFEFSGDIDQPEILLPEGFEDQNNKVSIACQFRAYQFPPEDYNEKPEIYLQGRLALYADNEHQTADGSMADDPIAVFWHINQMQDGSGY